MRIDIHAHIGRVGLKYFVDPGNQFRDRPQPRELWILDDDLQ